MIDFCITRLSGSVICYKCTHLEYSRSLWMLDSDSHRSPGYSQHMYLRPYLIPLLNIIKE